MIVSRLAHVALDVPDLEAATAFYTELFGLVPVAEAGGRRYLAGGRTSTYELELAQADGPGLDHVAFALREPAALDTVRERLAAAGATPTELDVSGAPGLSAGLSVATPAGHVVELVVEDDPVGYRTSATADPRHHRGVGPVEIEHVTLLADDIEATVRFAVDALGFRITESVQPPDGPWRNTHLRAGELHHDFAFLPGTGDDAPQLHHFCFAVPSVAELVRLSDALAARGIALDSSMGRHAGGNNVFLYFKDPFGHRVEVNTDMARIDAAAPPRVVEAPVPFDLWREGRPPAMTAGAPARDGRR